MEIIYLAAGRGSRLKKKTSNIPKCLVEINNKTILDYNLDFLFKFQKINIVTGYKSSKIIEKYNRCKKKINFIVNKKFKTTNMVHSMFLVKPSFKNIFICYGDIIFDHNLYKKIKNNKTPDYIFVNSNWLNFWKQRMSKKRIMIDAETLDIDRYNNIQSIGNKIKNKLPKYQFMGLIKLTKKNFIKLKKIYLNLDKKIDFTSFVNHVINSKLINFKALKTSCYWFEIDTQKDIKIAKKYLID